MVQNKDIPNNPLTQMSNLTTILKSNQTTQVTVGFDSSLDCWVAVVSEWDGFKFVEVFSDAEGDTQEEALIEADSFIELMEAS